MSRIDPSVDELMWLIAEQREVAAVDAFNLRYPEHRSEMMKRLEMVRELRGARPAGGLPSFQQRQVRQLGPPRWAVALGACGVLATVALGSYFVTRSLASHQTEKPSLVAPIDTSPPQPTSIVRETNELPSKAPIVGHPGPGDEQAIRQSPPPAYGRPVTLRLERVRLSEALRLIAQGSGVRIEVAPGTPDPEIACDYRDVPALLLLRDMGRTLGFTPLDQGDGSVLIIPAVDPSNNASASPAPTEGGSRVTTGDTSDR